MKKQILMIIVPGLLLILLIGGLLATQAQSSNHDLTDYRRTQIEMVGVIRDIRNGQTGDSLEFLLDIGDNGDPLYIAPLLDLAYFVRGNEVGDAIIRSVNRLADLPADTDWQTLFEWAGENDVALPPSYDEYKGLLLSVVIDPEFARFFQPGVQETARVNLQEAVFGGVPVDGIPSLVNARQITPEEATAEGESLTRFCREDDCSYPAQNELVFGVYIDGDARAYPLRLLNWHEMFNDVLGHAPLYDAPDGEQVCNFRAPTIFDAIARSGESWIQIEGDSAACPDSGWLNVDAIEWLSDDTDITQLPNIADDDATIGAFAIEGRVSGTPVMLAYCTLCGSGILYDVTMPELSYTDNNGNLVEMGETVLEFGSTGMLMRSNKLMYDRNTDTVWNALTGRPAFGLLASSDIELPLLPVIVTDWSTWLAEHPDTSVLSLDTGFSRDYSNGGAYEDYFNNPDFLMFPVWQQDTDEQDNKEVIFGLRLDGLEKAYPLEALIPEVVTNDTVGETDVVIVSRATPGQDFFEPGGAAVRAYERGDFVFEATDDPAQIVDDNGDTWTVTEDALIRDDGETLNRLPGHLAFWFGWYSFNPDTLVYMNDSSTG